MLYSLFSFRLGHYWTFAEGSHNVSLFENHSHRKDKSPSKTPTASRNTSVNHETEYNNQEENKGNRNTNDGKSNSSDCSGYESLSSESSSPLCDSSKKQCFHLTQTEPCQSNVSESLQDKMNSDPAPKSNTTKCNRRKGRSDFSIDSILHKKSSREISTQTNWEIWSDNTKERQTLMAVDTSAEYCTIEHSLNCSNQYRTIISPLQCTKNNTHHFQCQPFFPSLFRNSRLATGSGPTDQHAHDISMYLTYPLPRIQQHRLHFNTLPQVSPILNSVNGEFRHFHSSYDHLNHTIRTDTSLGCECQCMYKPYGQCFQ